MLALRGLLVVFTVVLFGYTAFVGAHHGWNLMPVFLGDIAALTWAGQFNLDFSCFLLLTGAWLAWRHHFSAAGIALAVAAPVGGMSFLAPYLLVASLRAKGDIKEILLGPARARA